MTQFLAKAQGMPVDIELALVKVIREFICPTDDKPETPLCPDG